MSWTDERIELLRKLWNEGLSASQVAAELGGGLTRNGVIGKVHRLGLAERAKVPSAPRPRTAKPPSTMRRLAAAGPLGNVALAFTPARTAPAVRLDEDVVIPVSERVELLELRAGMCRWPMGDPLTPEFRFCGCTSAPGKRPFSAKSDGGMPYCPYHAQVAYTPVPGRKPVRDAAVARCFG